jgi:class 3 adenylate cyclase
METANTTIENMEPVTARHALRLIREIDRIRDQIPEPVAMLTAVVTLLSRELQTELCMLMLRNRETTAVELRALHKRNQLSDQLIEQISRHLAEQVVQLDGVVVWPGRDLFPDQETLHDLSITAVPIIMGETERLGGILLARTRPFTDDEITLLNIAEDHVDSAIIQGYATYDMQQRLHELEAIYQIDHIRDQDLLFDEMLNAVLQQLGKIIAAEMGFIMLYDQAGHNLEMRAATHQDLFEVSPHYRLVNDIANDSLRQGSLIYRNDLGQPLHSVMCLPLILNDQVIGVLGVVNRQGQTGFSQDDQRLLSAIGSQMDTAIFESLEQRHLRQVLGRSVDPRVMEQLLTQSDTGFLEGQRRIVTVLYVDVRGSTSLAENTEPEQLVQFINRYLGAMTEVILAHEGTLDKFVGDEVMALFGAPVDQPDHAIRAVRAGLAMQAAHEQIVRDWVAQGGQEAPIGVGIATGELIVGEMGSAQRTDYTAIGRAANLGARICSVAQGRQVLISPATYELVAGQVVAQPVHGMQFKGVAGPTTVYHVTGVVD